MFTRKNPVHLTKMDTMTIYGKNHNYFSFCPMTVDSHLSDRCPLGYLFSVVKIIGMEKAL